LAAAIVDRLLHHGQVLYLTGGSYRVIDRTPDGPTETMASG
jgi:DNA replication protein DnaC